MPALRYIHAGQQLPTLLTRASQDIIAVARIGPRFTDDDELAFAFKRKSINAAISQRISKASVPAKF